MTPGKGVDRALLGVKFAITPAIDQSKQLSNVAFWQWSPLKIIHDFSRHSSNFHLALAPLVGNTKVQKDGCRFLKNLCFINVAKQTKNIFL